MQFFLILADSAALSAEEEAHSKGFVSGDSDEFAVWEDRPWL